MKELEELVKPLYKWLLDNYDAESSIIIEYGHCKVVRTETGTPLPVDEKVEVIKK